MRGGPVATWRRQRSRPRGTSLAQTRRQRDGGQPVRCPQSRVPHRGRRSLCLVCATSYYFRAAHTVCDSVCSASVILRVCVTDSTALGEVGPTFCGPPHPFCY